MYTFKCVCQKATQMIVAEKTYRTFSSQNYRWVLPEVRWSESCSVMFDSLQPHGLYSPWNSPCQNTRVGSLSLLQGIFPTQGSYPGLPHCGRILYQLSHTGSPRIMEWVAYRFSNGTSWPRNQTGVSFIAGRSLPAELWGKPGNQKSDPFFYKFVC